MAQPDRVNPWLALVALAILILAIWVTLWPLPLLTPQPQLAHSPIHCWPAEASGPAAQPVASVCLPAVPPWPVGRPAIVNPALSLNQIAG